MQNIALHFGFISLLPVLIALGFAIWSKRVIESLLLGILCASFMVDYHLNGLLHASLYSITNLFDTIIGHPADSVAGLNGIGLTNGPRRAELIIILLLLGAFVSVLEKSGGAYAFGERIAKRVTTHSGANTAAALMGSSLFTSAYFSVLATGTVFRPLYRRMKISKAKLAFIIDSTSAPINTLIPISGWVAYMATLMQDNIPGVEDGVHGLLQTMPYNFYCILMLAFVFLNARGVIKDYGPMREAELEALEQTSDEEEDPDIPDDSNCNDIKNGNASDMVLPLGLSVLLLIVLGLWNYTLVPVFAFEDIPLNGNQVLILSFSLGLLIALIKYTSSGLMGISEFLNMAIDGTKSTLIGVMIIILAITLGDLLRAPAMEGVGAIFYVQEAAKNVIPQGIVPFAVFILSSLMGFAMGTSWGVWAIMMPMGIPLTLAAGGDPFICAAAILSGGTFGDHCSPISDTTVMSSIGADCDHITHVNTQLYYAASVGFVSAVLYLIAGFTL